MVERIIKEQARGTRSVAEHLVRQAASQAFVTACVLSEMPSPLAPNNIRLKTDVVPAVLLHLLLDFEVGEGGDAFLFRDTK